jgi:hypothetical protein
MYFSHPLSRPPQIGGLFFVTAVIEGKGIKNIPDAN